MNYAYDGFGRYTSKSFASSGGTNTTTFGYLTNNSATSSLVSQYVSTIVKDEVIKYNKTFNYVYDDANMNITEVRDANNNILYKYAYDELDRLVREDNSELGKTFVYTYDDNGNILSEKIYSYTLEDVSAITPIHTYEYSYENENWEDQLTGYNGGSITYDEVGNPLSYWNGMEFNWENINNLSNISWNEKNISYEYNDEGIRTSKTVNGVIHKYVLEGSKILSEAYGDVLLVYLYDESDAPIGLLYRESSYAEEVFDEYYFTKNLQGDIIGIYDETGTIVVSYSYNAWGNCSLTDATEHGIGTINPFRYRGYYFDQETSFYYLNSRYYDPEIKRFINTDELSTLITTPSNLTDKNLYAYCDNNPIMRADQDGDFWHIIVGAVVGVVSQYVSDVVTNLVSGKSFVESLKPTSSIVDYVAAGASGALAASGVGVVGAKIANAAIDTTAYLVNSAINNEEINGVELVATAALGAMSADAGINGKKLRGVYNRSKQVLSTAVSSKKIAQYTAKITGVKTTVKKAIRDTFKGSINSGINEGIKVRFGLD